MEGILYKKKRRTNRPSEEDIRRATLFSPPIDQKASFLKSSSLEDVRLILQDMTGKRRVMCIKRKGMHIGTNNRSVE